MDFLSTSFDGGGSGLPEDVLGERWDMIIIGGGGAALRAAVAAHDAGAQTTIALKDRLGESGATVSQRSRSIVVLFQDNPQIRQRGDRDLAAGAGGMHGLERCHHPGDRAHQGQGTVDHIGTRNQR